LRGKRKKGQTNERKTRRWACLVILEVMRPGKGEEEKKRNNTKLKQRNKKKSGRRGRSHSKRAGEKTKGRRRIPQSSAVHRVRNHEKKKQNRVDFLKQAHRGGERGGGKLCTAPKKGPRKPHLAKKTKKGGGGRDECPLS